jgi:hypothetical protein
VRVTNRSVLWCVGLVVIVVGCGARTDLLLAEEGDAEAGTGGTAGGPTGGSGGVTDGGVAGSGGTAGSGGAAGMGGTAGTGGFAGAAGAGGTTPFSSCVGFLERETRTFQGSPDHQENTPWLVRTASGTATLAFRWDPYASAIDWPKLGHVSFDAWGPWDGSPLGPGSLGAAFAGERFVLGPDRDEGFAFLVSTLNAASPQPGTYLGHGHPTATSTETELYQDDPSHPLAVSYAQGSLLLVYANGQTGFEYLTIVGQQNSASVWMPTLGCATEPLQADAIPFDNGFLVALTTSRDFGTCGNDDGFDGPPTRIHLVKVRVKGKADYELMEELPVGQSVRNLRLVGRGHDAAWLVFQTDGGAIEAVRLNQDGGLYSKWNAIVSENYWMDRPAVAQLGDYVATAVIDAFDPSVSKILVQLHLEESMQPALSHMLEPPYDQWPSGPLALLGAPDGRSLLLAWTGWSDSGASRAYVKRLDCVE